MAAPASPPTPGNPPPPRLHPCVPSPLLSPGPERHGPVAGAHPPVRAAAHHCVGHRRPPRGRGDSRSEFGHNDGSADKCQKSLCSSQMAAMLMKGTWCFPPGCRLKKNNQNTKSYRAGLYFWHEEEREQGEERDCHLSHCLGVVHEMQEPTATTLQGGQCSHTRHRCD